MKFKTVSLAVLLMGSVYALPVFAATKTWNGANNANYNTAANWTATGVPGSADNSYFNSSNVSVLSTAGLLNVNVRVGNAVNATGALTINGLGTLTSSGAGAIGYNTGTQSVVRVTGTDAFWDIAGALTVGTSGNGDLYISNGAEVNSSKTSGTTVVGGSASAVTTNQGNVYIDGSGSKFTQSNTLNVGNYGNGYIEITNAGLLQSNAIYMGNQSTGVARIKVTGMNSKIDTAASWRVAAANGSQATIDIEDKGEADVVNALIGYANGGTGTLNVKDSDSLFKATTQFVVGNLGAGFFNVTAGGTANTNSTTNADGVIGAGSSTNSTAKGTVVVSGAGSVWNANGSAQTGRITYLATYGIADVTVEDSGLITTNGVRMGYQATGDGTLKVNNGEFRASGQVYLGTDGDAHVTVTNGGLFATNNTSQTYIGYNNGSLGEITVNGANSMSGVRSRWTANVGTASARIGNSGEGRVRIEAGGYGEVSGAILGNNSDGEGTLYVTGTGSEFKTNGALTIGSSGKGHITVTDHGVLNATTTNMQMGSVTGATADVTISDSGTVNSLGARIGFVSGTTGTVNIATGGIWNTSDRWMAGADGTGNVTMQTAGKVISTGSAILGNNASGNGTVTATNSGTQLKSLADVLIGQRGTGTLTLSDGAQLIAGADQSYAYEYAAGLTNTRTSTSTVYIADQAGSTGTLNIGAAAADPAAAAGIVSAQNVAFGAGTGTINFNHTNTNYDFTSNINGNGTINFLAGNTKLSGDTSGFTGKFGGTGAVTLSSGGNTTISTNSSTFAGTTNVEDTTLIVNGSLGGTTVIDDTGTIKGNGTVNNLIINDGGTAAPGNSIGTLNTTNVTFNTGSVYDVEINSAGQSDLINASGTATINGGSVNVIPFPDSRINSRYTILTAAGGRTGTFESAQDNYLFLQGVLSYDPNNVYLTLSPSADNIQAAALTYNQSSAAQGLLKADVQDSAINAFLFLDNSEAGRAALDALSGEVHASTASVLMQDQTLLRRTMEGMNKEKRFLPNAPTPDGRVWMRAFGDWRQTDDTGNTAEVTARTQGVLTGVERDWDDSSYVRAGVGTSLTNLDLDDRRSSAQSNNYHALVQGGVPLPAGTFLDLGAFYTYSDIATDRDIAFGTFAEHSSADYGAQTTQLSGRLGKKLKFRSFDLTPYVESAWTHYEGDKFQESGIAGLSGDKNSQDLFSTTVGADVDWEFVFSPVFQPLGFHAGIGIQRNAGDTDPDMDVSFGSPGSGFNIKGAPVDDIQAVWNAGIDTWKSNHASFGFQYEGGRGSDSSAHAITARFKWEF